MTRGAWVLAALTILGTGFSQASGGTVLNNFVTELLNVKGGKHTVHEEYSFTNPRKGWVFIRCTVRKGGGDKLSLSVDQSPDTADIVHRAEASEPLEAMRYLPSGEHKVYVRLTGGNMFEQLVVRTMPEILYANFGYYAHVKSYPKYDWAFLKRIGLLDNVNVIVGPRGNAPQEYLTEWTRMGRRWIAECGVVGMRQKVSAEEAYKYWMSQAGLTQPGVSGVIADEFYPQMRFYQSCAAWIETIPRIQRESKDRVFYPYVAGDAGWLKPLVEPLVRSGVRFAYERYLHERPTESEAGRFLKSRLTDSMAVFNKYAPAAAQHAIIVLGLLCAPNESLNKYPLANYKVYMDMQFNLLANDPEYKGLYGVMEYLSAYADEEYLRWAVKLYRHYCIEGKTEILSDDPYALNHIDNPNFEAGTTSWQVSAAEAGSIITGSLIRYGWLLGFYPEDRQGDTFLLMHRSKGRANSISQEIRNLTAGRYYSVKMFSGDKNHLGTRAEHAVSINLDNVELVPRKCFREVFHNCYSHQAFGFTDRNRAWFNYHFRVFRAKGKTARITITDWTSEKDPGGPIGQDLMINFIEIEPYLMD